jgi:predicted DCC family thiol-disulfide oxidoreductase YuxK
MAPASQMPLLYDRDCGFCRVSVALILAWDRHRRIRPVEIQSDEGERLLGGLSPEQRLESAHVIEGEGLVRSGGAAAAPVLDRLPGGAPLARLARRIPGTVDRWYRFVADHRPAFGRPLPQRAKRWADRAIAERNS